MDPEIYDKSGQRCDMAWLRQKYGNLRFLDAGPGPKFRLMRVDETEGPAVLKVRLLDEQGRPMASQPVANHWPDPELPDLHGSGLQTLWRERAFHQDTDSAGFIGFGLGTGSYIASLQEGGPHTVWVLSPSLASDGMAGLGMLGGTNHEGPLFLTFQVASDDTTSQPPPGPAQPPPIPASDAQLLAKLEQIHADLRRLMAHLNVPPA